MASSLSRRLAGITATGATVLALIAVPVDHANSADAPSTLTLLNINDFHGRISPSIAMGLANTVQTERAAASGDSMLLSAGDNVGASLYASSVQKDKPTIDFLNALGLQATAVGNHEFDAGWDDLVNRIVPSSNYSQLGANVLTLDGAPALDPYYTYTTAEGVKVAVIGAVTTETPQLTDPSALSTIQFTDPVAAVNRYAEQLSDGNEANGEADLVIAEYHEGVNTSATATDAIINQTSGAVDVIFTGHTHEEYVIDAPVPGENRTRPVLQTGNYGDNLGKVVLNLSADGTVESYTAGLVPNMGAPSADQIATDPVLATANTIITDANAYATEQGSVVAGQITGPITTGYDPTTAAKGGFDMRDRESTMGHLVADMYLHAANSSGRTPADIGIVNPGGLRDELPAGLRTSLSAAAGTDVRVMDIVNVTPFANNLWTTELTGAQLRSVLEEQWQQTSAGEMATRPYLQLGFSSNVTYTYTGAPTAEGYATRGSNILDVFVNGTKVADSDTYTVAIPSFLLGGGDNFGTLSAGANAKDTALVDSDAFVSYFKEMGSVSPNYAKQAVQVQNLTESYDVNGALTFDLADLNVDSYGVPSLTELKVTVGGIEVGTATVAADGTASISLDMAGKGVPNGTHEVLLTDGTGVAGTVVRLSANFTGEQSVPPVVEPSPEPSEPVPSPEPSQPAPSDPAPSPEPSDPAPAEPTADPSATPAPTSEPTAFEYENCRAVWDDLDRPIKEGEPGFHPGLDSDGDGVGCETDPDYTNDSDDSGYSDSSGLYGSSGYGSNGSSQRLAHTGFTSIMIAAAGALAVFAGGAVLVANRRRKA